MNDCRPLLAGTKFGLQARFNSVRQIFTLHLSKENLSQMANRKGVFIGAYVPNELKESLRRRAAAEHRTLSQEITRILVEAVHGKGLPTGSVDRRDTTTIPRRRSTDPLPRRRAEDLPYIPGDDEKK
jgi:plasmid stability protein